MNKKSLLLAIFIFSSVLLSGQHPFLVYFVNADSASSTSIRVDVKVKDYDNVYGAQMFMTWDSTVYTYDTMIYVNSVLENFAYNNRLYYFANNHLAVGWSDGGLYQTLPDDTTIFSVILNVVGTPCDSTTLEVVDLNAIYRSLATFDLNGDIMEEKIRYDENVFTIPGGDCNTTGIKDYDVTKTYVYPNPISNVLNIRFDSDTNDDFLIEFYTPEGVKVHSETFVKNSYDDIFRSKLNFENINSKLLFVKITDSGNNIQMLKVLLQ